MSCDLCRGEMSIRDRVVRKFIRQGLIYFFCSATCASYVKSGKVELEVARKQYRDDLAIKAAYIKFVFGEPNEKTEIHNG